MLSASPRSTGIWLREHRDQLGPNVTWNIERGLELTTGELSPCHGPARGPGRAGQRVLRHGGRARLPGQPGRRRSTSTLDWVHEIDGVRAAHLPGLDGVGLPDLGHRAARDLGARGVHPGRLPVGLQLVGRPRATGRCWVWPTPSRPRPGTPGSLPCYRRAPAAPTTPLSSPTNPSSPPTEQVASPSSHPAPDFARHGNRGETDVIMTQIRARWRERARSAKVSSASARAPRPGSPGPAALPSSSTWRHCRRSWSGQVPPS